jgi:hypothetical protein
MASLASARASIMIVSQRSRSRSKCGRRIHLRQQTIANGWTLRTDVDRDAGALDQCDEASDGEMARTPIWLRVEFSRS